jgi:osmotically-inducible protein OsmY
MGASRRGTGGALALAPVAGAAALASWFGAYALALGIVLLILGFRPRRRPRRREAVASTAYPPGRARFDIRAKLTHIMAARRCRGTIGAAWPGGLLGGGGARTGESGQHPDPGTRSAGILRRYQSMRSDSEIKRDVEDELRWDPDLDESDIAVAAKDGVVTLTGFVKSYKDKWQAERAAKRVHGVLAVVNNLEVRLPGIDEKPDPEIAREAVAAIKSQLPFSYEKIKVVVKNGWVTLEGDVEWNYQREAAERAVRRLTGIKGVSNLIQVKPTAPALEIKRKIEEAFRRSAEIDANRITVEADGGTVILKGTVRSWAERQEAERAAWAAPGVTKVINQIVVSP